MAGRSENVTSGIVVEALPNATFRVRLDNGEKEIIGHLSGKMRLHRIKVFVGDKVTIEMASENDTKGRITRRS